MTASGPCSSITRVKFEETSSSASSQEIGSNRPDPFGPLRRSGVVMRSGL